MLNFGKAGRSGLDRTDDFQKFWGSGLDRIQFLRIRIGLGLENFTVRSSLAGVGSVARWLSPKYCYMVSRKTAGF